MYSAVCINNIFCSTINVKLNRENDNNGLSISIKQKVGKKQSVIITIAWIKSNWNNCQTTTTRNFYVYRIHVNDLNSYLPEIERN